MADVKVRNKTTGEEKEVPYKVYENLKHAWALIGEADSEPKKQSVSVPPVATGETHPENQIQVINHSDVTRDIAEYEKLSGKKPDGRWSPAKLAEKLAELKQTQDEVK